MPKTILLIPQLTSNLLGISSYFLIRYLSKSWKDKFIARSCELLRQGDHQFEKYVNDERTILLPGAERLAELSRARKEAHWCRFHVCKCGNDAPISVGSETITTFQFGLPAKSPVFWDGRGGRCNCSSGSRTTSGMKSRRVLVHMSKCKDFNITWPFPQIMVPPK